MKVTVSLTGTSTAKTFFCSTKRENSLRQLLANALQHLGQHQKQLVHYLDCQSQAEPRLAMSSPWGSLAQMGASSDL